MSHGDKKVTGWDFYFFRSRMAFRHRIAGITPERALELPWCFNRLCLPPDGVLLDIGSRNSEFPLFVLWKTGRRVVAIDPDPIILEQRKITERLARRISLQIDMVSFQQQGATQMNFPDHSFDAVTAISVLEHISGDGDTSAMSEIYRVLKPGGHLYFTVPCASKYIEEFLPRDVHDQKYDSKPVFFSRLYDEDTLRTHLLDRTPMRVTEKMIFGQPHFDFSRFWWKKFPLPLKLFFCWMSPWLASLFYRQVDSPSESSGISIACFMMRKD